MSSLTKLALLREQQRGRRGFRNDQIKQSLDADSRLTSLEGRVTINEGDIAELFRPTQVVLSTPTTLSWTDRHILVDTPGITITLAAAPSDGDNHRIRNISGGAISIDPNGRELEGDTFAQLLYNDEVIHIWYSITEGWRV